MFRRHPRFWVAFTLWAAVGSGCTCSGFGGGGGSCNLDFGSGGSNNGCGQDTCKSDAAPQDVLHGVLTGCGLDCDPGYSSCDGNDANGCETFGPCPTPIIEAGPPPAGPVALAVLFEGPSGLAVCSGTAFVLDGPSLIGVPLDGGPSQILWTGGPPAGGLACDGVSKYWATADDGGGRLLSVSIDGGIALVSAIDPGRGIDLDDAGVYWLARSWLDGGGGIAQTPFGDAATSLVAPGQEGPVYKTFAVAANGLFSIADDSVYQTVDGSTTTLSTDASALALAPSGTDMLVLTGEDSGTGVRDLADGGLLATLNIPLPRAMVATPKTVYVAFDYGIVSIDRATLGQTLLASGLTHVADLALDDTYIYFTTLGDATQLPTLWRMPR